MPRISIFNRLIAELRVPLIYRDLSGIRGCNHAAVHPPQAFCLRSINQSGLCRIPSAILAMLR
jgi:hypothetical protein